MHTLACLVLIALAYTIQGAPSPHRADSTDAPIGKYPYQVSLRFLNDHMCSGSIVNSFNVLTSGYCISMALGWENYLKVHVGTNFLNVSGGVYGVERIVVHDSSDIGLVHLANPFAYSALVQPVNLNVNDENLEGKSCTLSGWGKIWNGPLPNNLQEFELIVYPQKKCLDKWSQFRDICALTKEEEMACPGDSGGPLVANKIQFGMVPNHYLDSCLSPYPDDYIRISSHITWIAANLK